MTHLASRWTFTAAAAIAAAAGVLLVYGAQIDTGLYYDDYHFLRPSHPLELRRVWFGSWDPTGIESAFFRPVTAWLFALRFWLFGLNSQALHLLSLAGHVASAVFVAWFVRREHASIGISIFAAWLYAVHPLFPYAQVSWLTNQMHLAASVVVLLALLAWQSVRDLDAKWFAVLLPFAAVAFLIKEDAVMLLPVLFAITTQHAWLVGPWRRGRLLKLLVTVLATVGALIIFRQSRLGELGGYGVPDLTRAEAQFWKGLDAALLLWPTPPVWRAVAALLAISLIAIAAAAGGWKRQRVVVLAWCAAVALLALELPLLSIAPPYPRVTWQGVSSGLVIAATIVGVGFAARMRLHTPTRLMLTGATITLGFNLPFALVSKREQYHLVALGAVLLLTGCASALRAAAPRWPRVAFTSALIASLPLALLARVQAAAFHPCAPAVLSADGEASGWTVVPAEIRGWLGGKKERCAAGVPPGNLRDLPRVAWGLYDSVEEDARWTSDRVVLLLRADITSISFGFRNAEANAGSPVRLSIRSGGRTIEVTLDTNEWKYATVRLRNTLRSTLRSGHLVVIEVTPWFVPAVRDPRQLDVRRYGVQLRIIEN